MMANLLNYIVWDPDPILFHLGPIALRYYATCWLVGLLLGYLLMQRLYRQQKIGDEKFEPLFIYIFIGILAGARLGHCLFYQPEYFLSQWDHVVEMLIPMHHLPDGSWKFTGYEGLASHGGVIGLFVAIWLYCRNLKVKGWVVLDNMGICSGIAAAFIRIGNLMNYRQGDRCAMGFHLCQGRPISPPSRTALRGDSLSHHLPPYLLYLQEEGA